MVVAALDPLVARRENSDLEVAMMRLFVNWLANKVSSEEVQPTISTLAGQVQTMPSLEWDEPVWTEIERPPAA